MRHKRNQPKKTIHDTVAKVARQNILVSERRGRSHTYVNGIRLASWTSLDFHCWDTWGLRPTPTRIASRMTRQQLLLLPNIGATAVQQIETWLTQHGKRLREESLQSAAQALMQSGRWKA